MPLWLTELIGSSARLGSNAVTGIGSLAKDWVWDSGTGEVKWDNIASLVGMYGASRSDDSESIAQLMGLSTPRPTGYMGGIPDYTYKRELVPNAFTSNERDNAGALTPADGPAAPRRPGSAGRRYFTDGVFAPTVVATAEDAEDAEDAGEGEDIVGGDGVVINSSTGQPVVLSDGAITTTEGTGSEYTELAGGGLASLKSRGYYLGGRTDGMADQVPATIDQKQPARLSDGEFVVPADVVSHLGNGSSNAGADQLFSMMDRVRKARTGRKSQGKEINPQRYLG
jgi:hypothetical protein